MILRTSAVALPLLFLIAFSFVSNRSSAATLEECRRISPNHRPAIASDPAVQNGVIRAGDCYDPNTPGVSMTAEQAKRELKAMNRGALSQCAPATDDRNIDRLNDTFAVCAAQFLKDYTSRYGRDSILITSAFRDGAPGSAPGGGQSANQCAGGAGASNHTRGVAMDVAARPEGTYERLWRHASQNPQFGVCFPYQDGRTGSIFDRPHMILGGIGGREASLCAQQSVSRACSGAPPLNIVTGPPGTTDRAPLGLGNLTRGLFGGQQPPPPMQMPPSAQQPVSSAQPITSAFTPTTAAPSQTGTTATLPQTQTQTQTSTSTNTNINTNFNTNVSENLNDSTGTTSPSSASDLLAQLAVGSSGATSSSALATSVPLVITGAQAGSIAYVEGQGPQDFSATSVGGIAPTAQQTFTSGNLSEQGFNPGSLTSEQSTFLRTLTTLRALLYAMLEYLKPFGGQVPGGDGTA